ncbi:sodium-translocating pyrophosphatase [Candidatus Cytomitobacter primus]|uniref:K(+)-insensitive pyrophosphate-energized proton pump n=1 Tax=Candidatus Cytomitobacter primus TaxID=2066024 RepID=A0A5C0UET9_9PROT|nr:sodium-translocating pyrophosphatase [Candidatus Cytomitobacter primus]QEK38615.1 sodium-translocating pyrophosphatase [Candidatus Cytomitobacter primus]
MFITIYYACFGLSFILPLVHAYYYYSQIVNIEVDDLRKLSANGVQNQSMREIGNAIKDAAQAYLKKQYTYVALVSVISAALMYFIFNIYVVSGFIIGSFLSGLCGVIGMHIAVMSNMRTAQEAKKGLSDAFNIALKAGKATGFVVGGISMMCVAACFFMIVKGMNVQYVLDLLLGLSFGASVVSVFARLGGGIFTKAADVGADLVGKIEKNIPEDDPRNPAVIADNVGDNVGDCAGTSADLFETYIVGFMAVLCIMKSMINSMNDAFMFNYPFIIAMICSLGCYIAILSVNRMGRSPLSSLASILIRSALFSLVMNFAFLHHVMNFNAAAMISIPFSMGIFVTFALVLITNYYTSSDYNPVHKIARSSKSGHAMNIITGLSISMESCFGVIASIVVAMLVSYSALGLQGIGISVISMLGMITSIVTLDAYGPITDNAGGIAEMSGQDPEVRERTDELDAIGNTTKALTKGYAVGSTALAAIIILYTYIQDTYEFTLLSKNIFRLDNVFVMSGLLIGGALTYWYSSFSMNSVAVVGESVVDEVRNQFDNDPKIMTGESKPDYARTVSMLTEKSIKSMFAPIAVVFGGTIFFFLICLLIEPSARFANAFAGMGGLITGVTLVGILLAISMTTGGGAWDNAKKYIEDGNYGGKGSDSHKAAVTGDTVGDPYKDTSGPALNPMIKMVNIIAILIIKFIFR